jgi:hypothetical protein
LPSIDAGARSDGVWPALPPAGWRDTYATLHLWTQIVGKTRLALAPMENHWWQAALYVTSRGLTTSPMPSRGFAISVDFDFFDHRLHIRTSDGAERALPLAPQSVADFYAAYGETLRALGHDVRIRPVPVEVERAIPFAEDREHAAYDPDAAHRWWRALVRADLVMKTFRGAFLGKSSPVHFWWGAFDLATTRFSGRPAPRYAGRVPNCPDYVMVEAYTHECSSCGFWPGGDLLPEPAFYAYAYPEPAGYRDRFPGVPAAYYHPDLSEFILPYEAVPTAAEPDKTVLTFFQSAYEAAADLGRWDRAALER